MSLKDMARDDQTLRSVARNKRARHEYLLLEELECGIVLKGTEVKSLRAGRASLQEAYGHIKAGELWLMGATIPEYSHGNVHNHKPGRERKVLVHRREIARWARRVKDKGITIVPLEIFFRGHLVKIQMALAQGKKLHDKRQTDRDRTHKREMDRAMAQRREV